MAAATTTQQRYVPHTLASLSPAQVAASRAAVAALARLGDEGALGAVVEVPPRLAEGAEPPAAAAAAAAGGEVLCEAQWPAAARRGGALEAAWEASPPFAYDWSSSGARGGEEGNGAGGAGASAEDNPAARLERFSRASMAPLLDARSGALVRLGWGRYMENRVIYTSPLFTGGGGGGGGGGAPGAPGAASEARTWHLGVDLGAPAGTAVLCPLDATVHSWGVNAASLDYGPTVVLRHELPSAGADGGGGALAVYSLYGHLSLDSVLLADGAPRLRAGQRVARGERVGSVGASDVNGGWPPHLHFQLVTELDFGGWRGDYPGVCGQSSREAYELLTPDANLVLRCPLVARVGW